jgi:hypothetical protein
MKVLHMIIRHFILCSLIFLSYSYCACQTRTTYFKIPDDSINCLNFIKTLDDQSVFGHPTEFPYLLNEIESRRDLYNTVDSSMVRKFLHSTIWIQILVDSTGGIKCIVFTTPFTYTENEKIIQSLRKWKFSPARNGIKTIGYIHVEPLKMEWKTFNYFHVH